MKKILFLSLLSAMGLVACISQSAGKNQQSVQCGRFEICHGNHHHRNARHHSDVHHPGHSEPIQD